jgi:23S rRNA (uracil1939-C5)-methyltransferase
VEGDAAAFGWLRQNLARGRKARALDAAAHHIGLYPNSIPKLVGTVGEGPWDALVVDPPRSGFPGLGALLERVQPARIVLVSCDPATGARDLKTVLKGPYELEKLLPIDAFVRTSHVEWVATCSRA